MLRRAVRHWTRPVRLVLLPLLAAAAAPAAAQPETTRDLSSERRWTVAAFAGVGTAGGIEDLPLLQARFVKSYLVGGALARDVGSLLDGRLRFEVDGQLVKHVGMQRHEEANVVLLARWTKFPWNDRIATSIAVGEGITNRSAGGAHRLTD